ncbi:MAG: CHAP domain-containing protein [Oscillospiraceae bacterium]|nr:CHAP domain-containing protein [Oscillospiraceae bacterium]
MEEKRRIKTREVKRDIKVLDKSVKTAGSVRRAAIRTKDQVQDLVDDGTISPEEYTEQKLRYAAEGTISTTGHQTGKTITAVQNQVKQGRITRERSDTEKDRQGHRDEPSVGRRQRQQEIPNTTHRQYSEKQYEVRRQSLRRQEQTIRTADTTRRTIKKASDSAGKAAPKTIKRSIKTSGKTVRTAEGTARGAVKTAQVSAQAAKKTAEVSARAAKTTAALTKRAAVAAYKAAIVVVKAVVTAVKGIIAAAKELITAIVAGGWIAVAVIVGICLIGLIVGSAHGIFFSSEDTGGGMTMRQAVQTINEEYENQIELIKMQNPYDDLEMSGSRAVWPQVLSVYAVKTTTDPDNAMDVATMDDQRMQLLSDIFWAMNDISYRMEIKTETIIVESDDGEGNIIEEEVEETHTTLYIFVSHLDADEMADQFGFDSDQDEQLEELLAADSSMWLNVLYGVYGSDDMIVQVALSQIGNIGGEPYWSWYGFNSHVEWCACFVSWCADQCGYIEMGVIPKFAGCVHGVNWFKERGQWADRTIEPTPGMIIFFDWDDPNGSSGPQDGLSDHTGIVEKIENGFVCTVEGNSRDRCVERWYPVGSYIILGYGVPAY